MVFDKTLVKLEFEFIPFIDLVGIAHDRRKTNVDAVAVKDPGKTLGQNRSGAGHFDDGGGMLPARSLPEVLTGHHEVPVLDQIGKFRTSVFKNMFCKLREVRTEVKEPSRRDEVSADVVPEFPGLASLVHGPTF
jgi:hypothetical protein